MGISLGIILEHHFVEYKETYWTRVQCDTDFWKRYLDVFESVNVCARVTHASKATEIEGMLTSTCEGVSFFDLPDFRGSKGLALNAGKVLSVARKMLASSDRLLFRAPNPIILLLTREITRSGIPFAVELAMNPRTAYSPQAVPGPMQPLIREAMVRCTKDLCAKASGVSYVTDAILQAEYPCKALQGHDGFTASYSTIELPASSYLFGEVRPRLPVRLIHVGTMDGKRKGQDVCIEVVELLRRRGIPVSLVFCGDGVSKTDFETCVQERGLGNEIEFFGWASHDKLLCLLDGSDIMVFPSRGEGLPRVLIEAMSRGVLCIASMVDGIPELLSTRCMSPNNLATEYCDRIVRFLEHPEVFEEERRLQFAKSKKYEKSVLDSKRRDFYRALRQVEA